MNLVWLFWTKNWKISLIFHISEKMRQQIFLLVKIRILIQKNCWLIFMNAVLGISDIWYKITNYSCLALQRIFFRNFTILWKNQRWKIIFIANFSTSWIFEFPRWPIWVKIWSLQQFFNSEMIKFFLVISVISNFCVNKCS